MSSIEKQITAKMRGAGRSDAAIAAFLQSVAKVMAGESGVWPEAAIRPVEELPRLEDLPAADAGAAPWNHLAVIKLNGGLGTTMGLQSAKSLLPVREGQNFLDFIARQILHLRHGREFPWFYLMNSRATREDSLRHLRNYPELWRQGRIDFLQNEVPKLIADTLQPAEWSANPDLEWCPPGHGDIYAALAGEGLLEVFQQQGIEYLFVSNSDNLGATAEPRLLDYFAKSGLAFLMEVTARTAADRKGGHLAINRADGRFLLREGAQCPAEETGLFQDIARHRYFNTNNLWIHVGRLREALVRHGGALPLPLIKNRKTVDPRDPASPRVLQLETAMGAAIECFEKSGAIVVPRERFSPVKTTADLLALRSDAYEITPDGRLVLLAARRGQPPVVELDNHHYQMLADFERAFPAGAPSLKACEKLTVEGPLEFASGVRCAGVVELRNEVSLPKTVAPGHYANQKFVF